VGSRSNMRIIPNVRRRGVFPAKSYKNDNNIFGCIDRHREHTYLLESAYKILQFMPPEVRKDFLKVCEKLG
jgi:hypothetical protein